MVGVDVRTTAGPPERDPLRFQGPKGDKGDPGDPSELLAPEWATLTGYSAGDIVHRAGRALRVRVDHTTGSSAGSFDPEKYEDLNAAPDAPVRLMVPSSDAGGDAYDSTGRITLESYQRPEMGPWGEVVRHLNRTPQAKTMQAWYHPVNPALPYHPVTNPMHSKADVWVGAHYAGQTDGTGVHGHWSVETPMASGALHSRFGIDWINNSTSTPGGRGQDVTSTYVANSDFSHRQGDGAVFRIASGAGSAERRIEFSAAGYVDGAAPGYFDTSKARWQIVVNQTAESGSGVGADWLLRRFDNAGAASGTVIFAKRSTGNVTFGESSDQDARVAARWAGGPVNGFAANPTASPSGGFASYSTNLFAAADLAFQARVAGDSNARLVANGNGKLDWGTGAAGRDTTLERKAPGVLGVGASHAFRTGVVASRPSAASVGQGSQLFDSVLNRPIWSTGSAWVDAMGQPV